MTRLTCSRRWSSCRLRPLLRRLGRCPHKLRGPCCILIATSLSSGQKLSCARCHYCTAKKRESQEEKRMRFMPKTSYCYRVRVGRDAAPPRGAIIRPPERPRAHRRARAPNAPPVMFPANSISGNLSRAAVKCKYAPATACAPAMGIVTGGREKNAIQGKKSPTKTRLSVGWYIRRLPSECH